MKMIVRDEKFFLRFRDADSISSVACPDRSK
jgi:hypothetical protein